MRLIVILCFAVRQTTQEELSTILCLCNGHRPMTRLELGRVMCVNEFDEKMPAFQPEATLISRERKRLAGCPLSTRSGRSWFMTLCARRRVSHRVSLASFAAC